MAVLLRLEAAKSVFALIRDGAIFGGIGSVGVTPAELRLVTDPIPWVGTDRPSVVRAMESLLYGSLDVLGLPRIRVPAEYVAAVVCVCVSACNISLACSWMQREASASTDALVTAAELGGDIEPVSAERLFALCCEIYETEGRTAASSSFELRLKEAMDRVNRNETKRS